MGLKCLWNGELVEGRVSSDSAGLKLSHGCRRFARVGIGLDRGAGSTAHRQEWLWPQELRMPILPGCAFFQRTTVGVESFSWRTASAARTVFFAGLQVEPEPQPR